MPTYKNDTEQRITHTDKTYISWNPGEARSLPYFVPYEELGLTLESPEPYVRRDTSLYLYRELVMAPGQVEVVKLPYHREFELSITCPKGLVKMKIGDGEEEIILDGEHTHVSRYAWDMTAWLTFEVVSEANEDSGGGEEGEEAYIMIKMEEWKR